MMEDFKDVVTIYYKIESNGRRYWSISDHNTLINAWMEWEWKYKLDPYSEGIEITSKPESFKYEGEIRYYVPMSYVNFKTVKPNSFKNCLPQKEYYWAFYFQLDTGVVTMYKVKSKAELINLLEQEDCPDDIEFISGDSMVEYMDRNKVLILKGGEVIQPKPKKTVITGWSIK